MSVSTNGQICYGLLCEDGTKFPWDAEKYAGDIETWWRDVHDYRPSVELYDEDGEYLGGQEPSQAQLDTYFAEYHAWYKAHPLPVELVNYCSDDLPMFILAVPTTCLRCERGYPAQFEPSALTVDIAALGRLEAFCDQYGIEYEIDSQLGWWLSSYWG